jgi:predicted nucleic acid-binding protein
MTKLFLDTNIVLDLLGERIPHYQAIAKIMTLVEQGQIQSVISALSFPTVYYILSKQIKSEQVKERLRNLKILCAVAPINEFIIEKSLNSKLKDFEDAIQYFCALHLDCDIILTRNAKDYKSSEIPVMTAEEYLVSIGRA